MEIFSACFFLVGVINKLFSCAKTGNEQTKLKPVTNESYHSQAKNMLTTTLVTAYAFVVQSIYKQ